MEMSNNKDIKFKLSIGTILIGIFSHLFCCILPLILMFLNLILGTSFVFKIEIFQHNIVDLMLYFSGIVLVVSFITQRRHNNLSKNEKIVLWFTTFLYVVGLVLHLYTHYQ
jgi:hypothetical protein